MTRRIEVSYDATKHQVVAAHYSDSWSRVPDADVVALFGTHVIPTPYTSPERIWDAVWMIRSRNAGVFVGVQS